MADLAQPIPIAVVGAGARGDVYAAYALQNPTEMTISAVVEPQAERRRSFAEQHQVSTEHTYESVDQFVDALATGQVSAVAAINASPDRAHLQTTVSLVEADANQGLDVMVEKPVGVTASELAQLDELISAHPDCVTRVCHVLRYAPFFEEILRVVESGVLGDIVTIDHRENIAYWHFAHSYVRGNWANAEESSPLILAKCSHDIDLMLQWVGEPLKSVSSSGSLRHFTPENAPEGAAKRCDSTCAAAPTCRFDARPFYGVDGDTWPANTLDAAPTAAARLVALGTSRYGRCVYASDNDVVDHQSAIFETTSGRTATLSISGHASYEARETIIDGVAASMRARFRSDGAGSEITVQHHGSDEVETRDVLDQADSSSGHGGGDLRLVADFLMAVRTRNKRDGATLQSALPSQFAALAAEQARTSGQRVDIAEFTQASYRDAAGPGSDEASALR